MSGQTDNVNYFIAWWSAVYSRLAYLNPQDFLGRYTEIFGDTKGTVNLGTTVNDGSGGALPATSVLDMMNKQALRGIQGLLDDRIMLNLNVTNAKQNDKRWGLNVIVVDGINASPRTPTTLTLDCITNYGPNGQPSDAYGEASQVASWAEKVNIILGERRKMLEDKKNPASLTPAIMNCAPALVLKDNSQLVFRAISDSNYGTTYVFGDKRAPNLVWVVFRGTANAKSALAYSRPSSLTPTKLVEFYGIIDAGLIGIFKILQEQVHIILQMAIDVAQELNPGAQLAPGSMKLLTTGHSLGGAMATAFAGEYAQQISPNLASITGATIFDVNIGCYSLASPRVFGPKEAALFCCLTESSALCQKDPAAASYNAADGKVKGKISYLRVVTTLDLVTALPKIGYEHPCSEFNDGERDMITMDCNIEAGTMFASKKFIKNKVSTRCLNLTHKRPAMTADFSKAPVCTDTRKKTLSISSMLYHLTYCGIMFAGGVDMSSALSLDVERLQQTDVQTAAVDPVALKIKANDTMMRVLWYGIQNAPVAKCVFFDLAPFRVNETMAQGGGTINQKGGWKMSISNPFSKAKVAPLPQPIAAPATAAAAPTAAPSPTAAPAYVPPAPVNSSVLLEDSNMTNKFIAGLKQAIANAKYNYDIKNAAVKPPIMYKNDKPPAYNYLYQLPKDIGETSKHTLFFGNNAPAAPPVYDKDKLDAHDEAVIDNHFNEVSSEDASKHIAAATAIESPIAATTTAPATATVAPAPVAAVATPATTTPVAPATATVAPATATVAPAPAPVAGAAATTTSTTTVAPAPVAPVAAAAVAAPAPVAAAAAPSAPATAAPAKGGKRTRRRNKSNNRSRKHGKGKKGARISRRGNKRHTKRH